MNAVQLIGRLTKDPEVRYTQNSGTAICTFTLAVDRGKDKQGNSEADFIRCKCFEKLAENMERYKKKGDQLALEGRIQTGSYEGNNGTVYTTDVICSRIEFIGQRNDNKNENKQLEIGFSEVDEPIPF